MGGILHHRDEVQLRGKGGRTVRPFRSAVRQALAEDRAVPGGHGYRVLPLQNRVQGRDFAENCSSRLDVVGNLSAVPGLWDGKERAGGSGVCLLRKYLRWVLVYGSPIYIW